MRRFSASTLLALLVGSASGVACDAGSSGDVGAPCESAEDCDGDLICDEHNGQASCQVPHGHTAGEVGTEGDSDSHDHETESDSHDHETEGDSHETKGETDGHDTEGDSHDHETEGDTDGHETEGDTEGHETEGHETEGDTEADSSETGDEMCVAYCTCMEASCASFEDYPYADTDACLAACGELEESTVACFGAFCEQAANSTPDGAYHQCEHAWGALGESKC